MSTIYRNLIRFVIYQSIIIVFSTPQYLKAQKLGIDPFFDSIYVAAHTLHDSERVRSFCNLSGMIISDDKGLSRRFLDTAKLIAARFSTQSNELKIAITEGDYFQTIANFEQAYLYIKKAVDIADKLHRYEYAIDLRTQVASLLIEMERANEAETYLLEALDKTKWLELNFEKNTRPNNFFTDIYYLYSLVYQSLANCYEKMPEKRTEIEPLISKAFVYGHKVHPIAAAESHLILAKYFLSEKKLAQAAQSIDSLETTYNTFKSKNANQMPWSIQIPLMKGLLAESKGDNSLAINYLNQAVRNFEKGGEVKLLSQTYKALTDVHRKMGNWQAALAAQTQFVFYQDSLTRKSQFQTINNLEAKYQNEKKQAQIEQQNAEITSRKRIQWGLLAGLVLFGAFSFLLYRQNQRIKSANEKNQKQATQLALMMKELHHRVKNNLQLVSSLLSLQSFQLADKSAAAAIQEGQTRVEAMSLIHQRLYQTKDVTELNFSNYAQDLVEKLVYAFGIDPHNFDFNLNIPDENLDVDHAMPLGLILNELLTNSFKYAFSKTEKPALSIDLQKVNDKWCFHYADNGAGLPPQYDTENATGFGTKLIVSLSQQLEGHYRFWNDQGLHFELKF